MTGCLDPVGEGVPLAMGAMAGVPLAIGAVDGVLLRWVAGFPLRRMDGFSMGCMDGISMGCMDGISMGCMDGSPLRSGVTGSVAPVGILARGMKGRRMVKQLPLLSSLSTVSWPRCIRTNS